MAFIVPVIRRDFPIYYSANYQHSQHSLVLQKRRCESVPVIFNIDRHPQHLSPSLPMASSKTGKESGKEGGDVNANAAHTPPPIRCQSFEYCPSDNNTFSIPAEASISMQNHQPDLQHKQQEHHSEVTIDQKEEPLISADNTATEKCIVGNNNNSRWEWLFPNKRVSFTLLDNDDEDDDEFMMRKPMRNVPTIDQMDSDRCHQPRRRRVVRFGTCERVEYDNQEDSQQQQKQQQEIGEGQQNQENQDPNQTTNSSDNNLRSCLHVQLQQQQQQQRSISSGRRRAASIPVQHLMPRPIRRVRTMSIPASMLRVDEKKGEECGNRNGAATNSENNGNRNNNSSSGGIDNELSMCIRNGKCNTVLFRLLSSIRNTSKM